MSLSLASPKEIVRAHTILARPPLCPELELHLITDACPLWRATEADLVRLGLEPPFWAFAWPGGQALARHLLDHPGLVRGKRILDFGCGGAIEGLAALRSGARSVLGADIDPLAVVAAELNAAHNGLTIATTTANLLEQPIGDFDLVLAGDVTYDPDSAERALLWLEAAAQAGIEVLLAQPDRGFLDTKGLSQVARYDAPADVDVAGNIRVWTSIYRLGR